MHVFANAACTLLASMHLPATDSDLKQPCTGQIASDEHVHMH